MKENNATLRETVYGKRICQCCKGFCHEGAWRYKHGLRKKYWCCESHLLRDKPHWSGQLTELFEQVDVITG